MSERSDWSIEELEDGFQWRWTCPECGQSMPRSEIPQHRLEEERRTAFVIVYLAAALAVVLVVAFVVVLVRWPR